jgi:hypothetical protein
MKLKLHHCVTTAVTPSPNVMRVATMFGLGIDEERNIAIVPPIELELLPGHLVFITGPSGSGKSSLLNLIAAAAPGAVAATTYQRVELIRFDAMPPLADRPIIDCFATLELEQVLILLSLAGLSDAFVMLRRPGELSDGQRYRLRLAQTMAMAQQTSPDRFTLVLADEFGATLDRITAAVIARNVRKWTRKQPHLCFIAATTHDDLLEALEPDTLIEKQLGAEIFIATNKPSAGTTYAD